jgi:hypothetical protein
MAIYSLRLPKIILVGNGVNIVFGEEKTSILESTYEWGGRINRRKKRGRYLLFAFC